MNRRFFIDPPIDIDPPVHCDFVGSVQLPDLVFDSLEIHNILYVPNRNLCANIRQLGKSLDPNKGSPYFCRARLRIR